MAGELDGPYESYRENGQLQEKGTSNMGEECGEWFEDGVTVTYPPCPPGLADGNQPLAAVEKSPKLAPGHLDCASRLGTHAGLVHLLEHACGARGDQAVDALDDRGQFAP